MTLRNFLLAALLSTASLLSPCLSFAALPAPDVVVKTTIQRVKDLVQAQPDKSSPVLDQKLRSELFPMFDFDQMSRSSLGAYWPKATPEEQTEFVSLFSDLLSRTYLKRIKSGVTSSKIDVTDAKVDGNKAVVKTSILADSDKVSVEYRMQAAGDKWKVYDVIIEGIGLISNYRTDFGSIIHKEGMRGLLAKLRAKELDKK